MTTHAVRVLLTSPEGKALLQFRKDHDRYCFIFFGGKVEEDEAPEAAAIREVQEETGITIQPENLHFLNSWTNAQGIHVLHYKATQPVSWNDIKSIEASGIAMVPYEDLHTLPLSHSMQWFLQTYPELPA